MQPPEIHEFNPAVKRVAPHVSDKPQESTPGLVKCVGCAEFTRSRHVSAAFTIIIAVPSVGRMCASLCVCVAGRAVLT